VATGGERGMLAPGSMRATHERGEPGGTPGLARSGVGDERIVGPLSRAKRRLGKEIREDEPEPEYPVVRS
jgi:hypothetical protein